MSMIGIFKGSLVDWVYIFPLQFYNRLKAYTPVLIASRRNQIQKSAQRFIDTGVPSALMKGRMKGVLQVPLRSLMSIIAWMCSFVVQGVRT